MVDRGRFAELAPEWDALAAREAHPFSLQAWLLPWWDAFGAGSRLRVLVVWRGAELAAAIALAGRGRTWQSLANDHTPLFAHVAVDAEALAQLARAVVSAAPGRLVLTGVPADGEASRAFESASRQARRPARAFPHIVSPIADLGGGVAGFYQDVSRKALKNVDRRRRRLEREHYVHTRPVFVPSQPGEAVTRFLALEESGWKGRRGTAIALLPEVERFYRTLRMPSQAGGSCASPSSG